MKVKDALQQLRDWDACSTSFDRVKSKRSIKSMIEAVSLSDLVWVLNNLGAPALAKYDKACDQALAEYRKVCDPASAKYLKVCEASAEYYKVRDQASAEYYKVRDPALAEYEKVRLGAARNILMKKFG